MRICIVTGGHWSAVKGGAEYQAYCLTKELASSKKFEIFYATRTIDRSYVPNGYQLLEIGGLPVIRKYSFFFDAPWLLSLLDRIKPDLVYQRGLQSYTGICCYYALKRKIPFVYHIASDYDVTLMKYHKVPIHGGIARVEKKIGEWGLKNASIVIAQTESQKRMLEKTYGKKNTYVVKNFHPKNESFIAKNGKNLKVVWVSNFKPIKRPELFVRLAEDCAEFKHVKFVMIGAPGSYKKYSKLHNRIRALENLEYLGALSQKNVNKELETSHLFINTSLHEGYPNTFIQAWMREVPVISVNVDPDGVMAAHGIGVCGKGYDGLLDATNKLLMDSKLRARMGSMAQKFAYQNHSMKNTEVLLSIFQEGGMFKQKNYR